MPRSAFLLLFAASSAASNRVVVILVILVCLYWLIPVQIVAKLWFLFRIWTASNAPYHLQTRTIVYCLLILFSRVKRCLIFIGRYNGLLQKDIQSCPI